jgi:hypothetical protein
LGADVQFLRTGEVLKTPSAVAFLLCKPFKSFVENSVLTCSENLKSYYEGWRF